MRYLTLIFFVFICTLQLRVPISYLPTMATDIIADLNISSTTFSWLVSAYPLLFFFITPWIPGVEKKWGVERILLLAMLLGAIAYLMRLGGSINWLLLTTVMFAISIAMGNVSLPTYIKKCGGLRIPILSAVYTASLYLGPALATSLTVPLKQLWGFGWSAVQLVYLILPLLALLLLIYRIRTFQSPPIVNSTEQEAAAKRFVQQNKATVKPFLSGYCYCLAAYFGILSSIFFLATAWLPTIITSFGVPPVTAAVYASFFTYAAIPFTIVTSFFIYRIERQYIYMLCSPAVVLVGVLGVIFIPEQVAIFITLMGIGTGVCAGIAFITPLLRFTNLTNISRVSSMMQAVGYLMAFAAPLIAAAIFNATAVWTNVLWFVALLLVAQIIVAVPIGKKQFLDARDELPAADN